jgi:hypothetical protein
VTKSLEPQTKVIDWLLEDDQPAVRYLTLTELLGHKPTHPDAKAAYNNIPKKGWASTILNLQNP